MEQKQPATMALERELSHRFKGYKRPIVLTLIEDSAKPHEWRNWNLDSVRVDQVSDKAQNDVKSQVSGTIKVSRRADGVDYVYKVDFFCLMYEDGSLEDVEFEPDHEESIQLGYMDPVQLMEII